MQESHKVMDPKRYVINCNKYDMRALTQDTKKQHYTRNQKKIS
eukprot:UN05829